MEKKQGFFSALREEVIRTLSPARSRSASPGRSGCARKKKHHVEGCATDPEQLIWTSESLRPVMEGPDPDEQGEEYPARRRASLSGLGSWVKGQLYSSGGGGSGSSKADLRLLLGVMGTPLAPVHVSSLDPLPHLSIKDTPIETLSAQYILQQYTAASGGQKLQNSIRNAYALGKLKMTTSEFETATKVIKNRNSPETGSFLLWQKNRDMWYVELSIGESKVHAGCNGKLVWRHTPWLGAHTAKGPVRPLRRALQGLDPRATASLFADAKFVGERKLNGEDCFILKLCADPHTLKARSEGPAEIIRHVLFGFFSQKTGLLVYLEDSHLARIQSSGGDAVYWETTINSFLNDYRPVEGVMVAHSGHSIVTLFRFGEMAMSHTKTRMEESWTIEEVAFNIPGLSEECFIPPDDLKSGSISEARELSQEEWAKNSSISALRVKVATLEKSHELQLNK